MTVLVVMKDHHGDNIIPLVSCFWSTFEKSSFRLGKKNPKFDHDREILVVGGL